jgi:hypothetical protein
MISNYYYDHQLRSYLLQFCAIFTGLHVATGKGEDGSIELLPVPITVGSKDRVVAALMTGNTHNRTFTLPQLSANIVGVDMAPERRKGVGVVDSRTYLAAGAVFPDDLAVVKRLMPIPFNMQLELSIYASNTDQLFQILEQLLVLFDPQLQIQTSDAPFDWTKITNVELTGITNEENYPMGTERRMIVWTLSFVLPIYLSIPLDIRDEVVHRVITRIGDLDGFNVMEYGEDGELQPFQHIYYSPSVTEIKN